MAVDHNLLTMETMKRIAPHHGLACLLHEKPFEGINGSGKHNNWSLSAPGLNLLDPGDTPMDNLQFLIFFAAVIKAVDEYQDLLRMTIASPGNEHRLGGNEAPPAIVSVFVGEDLDAILDAIASDSAYTAPENAKIDLGVDVLPTLSKDSTDRNRTSPFAFTGNKFEFRMPGSSDNVSDANTVLNTAVAKELKGYADELERAENFDVAVIKLVRRTIRDHKRVIFNGNGYSKEWEEEAIRRGLDWLPAATDAINAMVAPKNIKLFNDMGVMNEVETRCRYEVKLEHYSKVRHIEAVTMMEMTRRQLVPAATSYMTVLADCIRAKNAACSGISCKAELKTLRQLTNYTDAMSDTVDSLEVAIEQAEAMADAMQRTRCYHDTVVAAMQALRAAADAAEAICGQKYWPLPSYSQMLFYV